MKIRLSAIVDIGKERENNEDAYILCPNLSVPNWNLQETSTYIPANAYGSILVVADGMGGANAGEIASLIAIKSVQRSFSKDNIRNAIKNNDIEELLISCVKDADDSINCKIAEDPNTYGMGTTIVVCWVINGIAHIAWCGDSRCYVFNAKNGLCQLTKDHSFVQELIDKGEITELEAYSHPDNNIITRGLGDVSCLSTPEIVSYALCPNDLILICTDGLCGYVTNKEIEHVLDAYSTDIKKCRDELLKLALDAGGCDNICIALASLINDNDNAPSAPTVMDKILMKLKRAFK